MKAFQDSGFQWIGRIPLMWQVERIKRLVSQKITDGPHETPTLEEEGIPFISAEAIKSEKIDFDKKRGFISLEQHEIYSKKCKPQRNDIFIIKSGATTGNVAYVDTDIEFNIWSPLAVVRCDEKKAYYKFVFYQLLSDVFRKQVELSWSFGTQENIGMGVIGRINLVIPPIIDQYRIASYLDKTCAAIDKAIEAKQKQIETLDALRKSIIHKAVTRGLDDSVELKDSGVEWLGKIPKHWFITKLKNQCQIIPSNVDKKSHDDETEVRLCNYVDVYYNEFIDDSIEYMVATANEHELKKFQLLEGDVLITKDSEDPHDIAVPALVVKSQPKLLCGYHLTIIRSNNRNFIGEYLFWVLGNEFIASQLHRQATGITRWAIANKHVKNNIMPLPPREEQSEIAYFLGNKLSELQNIKNNLLKQISTLQQYRKSLIHECVTGKRRVNEDDVQGQL